jgi:hypothetical protein
MKCPLGTDVSPDPWFPICRLETRLLSGKLCLPTAKETEFLEQPRSQTEFRNEVKAVGGPRAIGPLVAGRLRTLRSVVGLAHFGQRNPNLLLVFAFFIAIRH